MTTTYPPGSVGSLEPRSARAAGTGRSGPERWLVAGGVGAGPLFITVSVAHAVARDGAGFSDQPPSALSNGDLGWVQVFTFVAAGVLLVGSALGLRLGLRGPGSTWGPLLIGVFGVGLIGGGLIRMDPAFGFPPGSPPGKPAEVSWHGAAHGLIFAAAFLALLVACLVFARRYRALDRSGLRWLSLATGPVALVLTAWPSFGEPDGRFLPLWTGVIGSLAWTSVVVADARRDLSSSASSTH